MGGTSSKKEETEETISANEIEKESGGFHVFEVHLASSAGTFAIIITVLVLGFLIRRHFKKKGLAKHAIRLSTVEKDIEVGVEKAIAAKALKIDTAPAPVQAPLAAYQPPYAPPIAVRWIGGGRDRFDNDRFVDVPEQAHPAAAAPRAPLAARAAPPREGEPMPWNAPV